jgi:hypothetical protein
MNDPSERSENWDSCQGGQVVLNGYLFPSFAKKATAGDGLVEWSRTNHPGCIRQSSHPASRSLKKGGECVTGEWS